MVSRRASRGPKLLYMFAPSQPSGEVMEPLMPKAAAAVGLERMTSSKAVSCVKVGKTATTRSR
jgi:hypothetical protein